MEPKDKFLDRYKALTYYGYPSDKLSYEQYKELAISLDKTPFPTMYGSTSQLEFFAETFYSYVHCVIQNKPYEMSLVEGGNEKEIILNGVLSDRCKTQREIIAQYFKEK